MEGELARAIREVREAVKALSLEVPVDVHRVVRERTEALIREAADLRDEVATLRARLAEVEG